MLSFAFRKYSGDVPTLESLYVITDESGCVNIVRSAYLGRFDDRSAEAFDVEAAAETAKKKIQNINSSTYNVTKIYEPFIGSYKSRDALIVQYDFEDKSDPYYTAHGYGAVIITPKI